MPKKILFIMQLPPPVHGASIVNKFIANSKALQNDYEIKILELKFVYELNDIGRFSWKKVGRTFTFLFLLVKTLRKFRPQLVYYTLAPKGFAFYRDTLFVSIIKLFGIKIAFHLHSRGIREAVNSSKLKRIIYRFVFRKQVAISLAKTLSGEFDGLHTKEILVLPNGIPYHNYDLSARKQNRPTLLFLANLFREKGIFVFIDIIKELKSRGIDFHANIVGKDGDVNISQLRDIAKQQFIADRITFSGPLYGDQKYNAFAEASIFVHPSLNEAFPLTILEAMQASVPVVASSVGAIPEMVENGRTGYICRPGEAAEFTEKLDLLINNNELRKTMGKAGREEYEMYYSMKQFENNLKKVIDHLMAD